MPTGPRLYNLFPLLAGPIRNWDRHLPRIRDMGFDWVFLNPFHRPGFSGSLYAVQDPYALHPLIQGDSAESPESLLAAFAGTAAKHGLKVMMDLVVNHTAKDSPWVEAHSEWYARDENGAVRSPFAIDPADANKVTVWGDLAEIDYTERPEREAIVGEWRKLVRHYAGLGFSGFRCDAAYKVPQPVWAEVIAAVREVRADALFAAETLGCRLEEVQALDGAGFDFLFNSAKWWDYRADWLLEQYERFRGLAPSIAFPESHDTERLVVELERGGVTDVRAIEAHYRLRYLLAAVISSGVMMPMGYEFGFRRPLHVVKTRPTHWEEPLFDLGAFVASVNAMKAEVPALNEEGPQRCLYADGSPVVGLVRRSNGGEDMAVSLLNPDPGREGDFDLGSVVDLAIDGIDLREVTPPGKPKALKTRELLPVPPLGGRVFAGAPRRRRRKNPGASGKAPEPDLERVRSRRVVIQDLHPQIDGGRYPIKREVGDGLAVEAQIFAEGHHHLAAVLKYRPADEPAWREAPMACVDPGTDRWRGMVRLERNARFLYAVEAWIDSFESWRAEMAKKLDAGQDIAVELLEGRVLVAAAIARADAADARRLRAILRRFDGTRTQPRRAALLLGSDLRALMARWPDRSGAVTCEPVLEAVVDRVQARFAAWYEMFPRSQTNEPGRSGTFDDCIRRLPEVREMGFDVIYFPPIHPIGRAYRKGPNNTLRAGSDDPGSPYAIGSAEGGHDAVHPDLGALADFRRLVRAALDHGLEVALDLAVQCAPDHPWIREHPEWFQFRPDGTIKHAENPPKKYQDIVNVDFQNPEWPALWRALFDIVMFWVDQGVRIFRVDNPHTKPVPFWEWLIREVQERHPEVLFLAEAFTRPAMLKMLAKAGFSQSYTYFTWRNFKPELIDYMTELTQSEAREYLRPNFFANTPDILPAYLQTGGRPAFMIRAVLAATLSSLYGIYSGFELCENEAIPGREEYDNSEKFEIRVWDWNRPGNIKDYLARINRIRRENPALRELENLRFHENDSDSVLFYGKMTLARDNMIFVAVNLDPFDAREAEIVFPLAEMGIPPRATYEVEELLDGAKHLWRGARQTIRLDPAVNPAAIYRVTPWEHVDHREPCF